MFLGPSWVVPYPQHMNCTLKLMILQTFLLHNRRKLGRTPLVLSPLYQNQAYPGPIAAVSFRNTTRTHSKLTVCQLFEDIPDILVLGCRTCTKSSPVQNCSTRTPCCTGSREMKMPRSTIIPPFPSPLLHLKTPPRHFVQSTLLDI